VSRAPLREGNRLAITTPPRAAEVERTTRETSIRLRLALDGAGASSAATGIGFFDHMLELLARHARFELEVEAAGDLETGSHHTAEDVGIALGQALDRALGDRAGIVRYGDATVPMDEALVACAIDISGRPYCAWEGTIPEVSIAGFETELVEEFFRAVANNAKLTVHVRLLAGANAHHIVEASFKSFARALRAAVSLDMTESGVPSTKGVL
jgi:imidazoleglycerol-phosphate dehydratase